MDQPVPPTDFVPRSSPRRELDAEVAIRFVAGEIAGSGQNISDQGLFFTADGTVPVTVHVAGRGEVRGRLVRVESMGNGRFGIAVRFDEGPPSSAAPRA